MNSQKPTLTFYSYDSLGNPWCGGGGAYRDLEILKQQKNNWRSITFIVGNHHSKKTPSIDNISFHYLGWGKSYLTSRLSYTLLANLKILFDKSHLIGYAFSIYSPLLTALFKPSRLYFVFHHQTGKQVFKKFGLFGLPSYLFEKLFFRFSKNVLCSNSILSNKIKKLNPKVNLLQTVNGFVEALLQTPPKPSQPPYILFLGRFDIQMKGLDLLIEAFSKLKHTTENLTLILAGRASEKTFKQVQRLIEISKMDQYITLKLNISELEKRDLLQSCLFFCSPSRYEGWGISALEANAVGKAVLVTQTDGYLDSISPQSGCFIPVNDIEALTIKMKELSSTPSMRERYESHAKEWASQFTWKQISAKEYNWVFQTFLDFTPH